MFTIDPFLRSSGTDVLGIPTNPPQFGTTDAFIIIRNDTSGIVELFSESKESIQQKRVLALIGDPDGAGGANIGSVYSIIAIYPSFLILVTFIYSFVTVDTSGGDVTSWKPVSIKGQ